MWVRDPERMQVCRPVHLAGQLVGGWPSPVGSRRRPLWAWTCSWPLTAVAAAQQADRRSAASQKDSGGTGQGRG